MSRRKRVRAAEGTLLAGWLFADLLLALSVVFLGVVPTTTTTTSTTTTTLPAQAAGLDINGVCLGTVNLRAPTSDQFSTLKTGLEAADAKGRRVGLLIITAGGPVPDPAGALGLRLKKETAGSDISTEFYVDTGKPGDDWAYEIFHNPTRNHPTGTATVKAWFY
ncbi:MAG: hypothetical protein WCG37_11705, partial [Actinomycetes bacterium]